MESDLSSHDAIDPPLDMKKRKLKTKRELDRLINPVPTSSSENYYGDKEHKGRPTRHRSKSLSKPAKAHEKDSSPKREKSGIIEDGRKPSYDTSFWASEHPPAIINKSLNKAKSYHPQREVHSILSVNNKESSPAQLAVSSSRQAKNPASPTKSKLSKKKSKDDREAMNEKPKKKSPEKRKSSHHKADKETRPSRKKSVDSKHHRKSAESPLATKPSKKKSKRKKLKPSQSNHTLDAISSIPDECAVKNTKSKSRQRSQSREVQVSRVTQLTHAYGECNQDVRNKALHEFGELETIINDTNDAQKCSSKLGAAAVPQANFAKPNPVNVCHSAVQCGDIGSSRDDKVLETKLVTIETVLCSVQKAVSDLTLLVTTMTTPTDKVVTSDTHNETSKNSVIDGEMSPKINDSIPEKGCELVHQPNQNQEMKIVGLSKNQQLTQNLDLAAGCENTVDETNYVAQRSERNNTPKLSPIRQNPIAADQLLYQTISAFRPSPNEKDASSSIKNLSDIHSLGTDYIDQPSPEMSQSSKEHFNISADESIPLQYDDLVMSLNTVLNSVPYNYVIEMADNISEMNSDCTPKQAKVIEVTNSEAEAFLTNPNHRGQKLLSDAKSLENDERPGIQTAAEDGPDQLQKTSPLSLLKVFTPRVARYGPLTQDMDIPDNNSEPAEGNGTDWQSDINAAHEAALVKKSLREEKQEKREISNTKHDRVTKVDSKDPIFYQAQSEDSDSCSTCLLDEFSLDGVSITAARTVTLPTKIAKKKPSLKSRLAKAFGLGKKDKDDHRTSAIKIDSESEVDIDSLFNTLPPPKKYPKKKTGKDFVEIGSKGHSSRSSIPPYPAPVPPTKHPKGSYTKFIKGSSNKNGQGSEDHGVENVQEQLTSLLEDDL